MMLSTLTIIEEKVKEFTEAYCFGNDKNLNVVLDCMMSDEQFDIMENEIERLLPMNIFTTRQEVSLGHFILTFKEVTQ